MKSNLITNKADKADKGYSANGLKLDLTLTTTREEIKQLSNALGVPESDVRDALMNSVEVRVPSGYWTIM